MNCASFTLLCGKFNIFVRDSVHVNSFWNHNSCCIHFVYIINGICFHFLRFLWRMFIFAMRIRYKLSKIIIMIFFIKPFPQGLYSCLKLLADSQLSVSRQLVNSELTVSHQLIVRQQSANSQPTDFFKEFFSITENPLINILIIAGHLFWQVTSPNKPFTVGFTLQNLSAEVSSDFINPLKPESDQHQISPYSNMAESFIKIMRRKEMITSQKSFDCSTNSPCQC